MKRNSQEENLKERENNQMNEKMKSEELSGSDDMGFESDDKGLKGESNEEGVEEKEREELNGEMSEIEKLENDLATTKDKYLRLAAEFDNYRKRTLKEKQDLILFAGEEVIKGILPIVDDFERAIKMIRESDGEESSALEGNELIYNKLVSYLNSKGVTEIEALGCKLDTDLHEAVAQVEVDKRSKRGVVIDVVEKGYKLNGKVIRFSKVVMGK